MRLSVVIPAFNEEGNIGPLIEETFAKVPDHALGEVIAVDDASDDGTGTEIKALLGNYQRLRYLRHGTRAGQSAALRNGVIAACCPVIATMDGDGQNDPADIMRLAARLGADGHEPAMAAGIRTGRKGPGSRKAASRFANFIRDKVLGDGCADTGCGIKLYRRDAFLALPYFASMHRYLPALFLTYGHEIAYAGERSAEAEGRVEIYQSRPRHGWDMRSRRGELAAPTNAASAHCRRQIGRASAEWGGVSMHWTDLAHWWQATPTSESIWIGVGLTAQLMFSMRFIVEWVATEKARASIIPETFWYFSFFGGALLLAYACYRLDPVFILGQATGLVIYSRNLYFIWLGKRGLSPAKLV